MLNEITEISQTSLTKNLEETHKSGIKNFEETHVIGN